MRKTDKKIDNQLRQSLTEVCDHALAAYAGFEWLTHTVDYNTFPKSLRIVCVFDTEALLTQLNHNGHKLELLQLIKGTLAKDGIVLNNIEQHVKFDTEAACAQQHHGNWALRLSGANQYH
ncbi:Fis family transcriptional regulator [Shewanella litoralis]|uniref:Fis family transcriptional regulator n=1 Tax=Shewanella litoralis TaxID=2282700 RepID=A0ABQ2R640_9GAMM|nr:Fis family transcriptional regulator [Shewanella litoralis]GGQ12821.1 hypothetical protein GCM10009411_11760 [Shewanella litoralis]